jgi:peptidoglycan/xylan/chitin deacetylase (PgdA/CDA1 family)
MGNVLVLCYHAVSERWPAPLSVTPRALEEQLGLLVKRGYRGITFGEAVLSPPPGRTVVVTFDDAFRSVLELARPILARLGLPATVFVPTDFPAAPERPMSWPGIDEWVGSEHEHEMRPMSWGELAEVAGEGWEIGSHTKSHPHLTRLGDAQLAEELADSRREIEDRLSRPCPALAYPYGDHDDRVVAAAGRAGYKAAGTLPARLTGAGPLRRPRVGVYRDDDLRRYKLKVSRPLGLLRATPLWPGSGGQAA